MLAAPLSAAVITLAVAAGSLGGSSYPSASAPTCQVINAVVTAEASRVSPALKGLRIRGTGTSRGDVAGTVTLDALKPFVGKQIDFAIRIVSEQGELIAHGKASTSRDTTAAATHSIRTKTEVEHGRGAFAESSGQMAGAGRVDTGTRAIELSLTGVVCADWTQAQAQARTR